MSTVLPDDPSLVAEWAFQRRADRCVIRRIPDTDGGGVLEVCGNGPARSYSFSELDRLIAFQSNMEAFLTRTGWTLESFTPEHRRGRDRRRLPRINNDRRRWWTDPVPHE